jgi:hypothetical protein
MVSTYANPASHSRETTLAATAVGGSVPSLDTATSAPSTTTINTIARATPYVISQTITA